MSFAQIIARLESMNAEISLFRTNYSYAGDDRWTASIEIKHDTKELQLKARGTGGDVEDAFKNAAVNTAVQGVGGALTSGVGSAVTDALQDLGVNGDTAKTLTQGATNAAIAAATGRDAGNTFINSVVPGLLNSAASSAFPTPPSELDQTLYPSEVYTEPGGEGGFSWSDVPKPVQQAITGGITSGLTGGNWQAAVTNPLIGGLSSAAAQQVTQDPAAQAALQAALSAGMRSGSLSSAGMSGLGSLFRRIGNRPITTSTDQQIAAAYADPSRGADVLQDSDYGAFGGGPSEGDVGALNDVQYGAEDYGPALDYATAVEQAPTPAPAPTSEPTQTVQEQLRDIEPAQPAQPVETKETPTPTPATEGAVATPDYGPDYDFTTAMSQQSDDFRRLLEDQGVQFGADIDEVMGSVNALRDLFGGDQEATRQAIEAVSRSTGASVDAINAALNGRIDALSNELGGFRGQIGGLSGQVGGLSSQYSSLADSVNELRSMGISQNDAINQVAATTGAKIFDVQAALQGQIGGLQQQFAGDVGDIRSQMERMGVDFGKQIGDTKDAVEQQAQLLRDLGMSQEEALNAAMDKVSADMGTTTAALRDELGSQFSDLQQQFAGDVEGLRSIIDQMQQESGLQYESIFDELGNVRDDFLEQIMQSQEAQDAQNESLRDAIDQMQQESGLQYQSVFDELGNVRQDFLDQLMGSQNQLQSGFTTGLRDLADVFGGKLSALGNQFSGLFSNMNAQQAARDAQQRQQAQQQAQSTNMLGLLGLLNQPQQQNKVEAAPLANVLGNTKFSDVSPYGKSLASMADGGMVDERSTILDEINKIARG